MSIRPIVNVDCPDPDLIRVDNTYYMLSTSMFFFPGCEILESGDLINWKHCSYVFNSLDATKAQRLSEANIYSAGMWAASFRYHNGIYYICFVANDTHKTYLFRSKSVKGPWQKSEIEGFYHDNSLLFDDDGRVYIAYGNREIYITELNDELTGPKEGGYHRMVVRDNLDNALGYEGTHFYKINGMYYLFFIHSQAGRWFRSESVYMSDSLEGEFVGEEVFCDDNGYRNAGIAQGAIVDTPEGNWYAMLFQDRGGSGRIPYLIPMTFEGRRPLIGNEGRVVDMNIVKSSDPDFSLVGSDDFGTISDEDSCFGFSNKWQFNHEPTLELISRNVSGRSYSVKSDCICSNPTQAKNSLTQRMAEPGCEAEVTICADRLKPGDYAGMCALQYLYGFIALRAENQGYSIVYMQKRDADSGDEISVIEKTDKAKVRFKIRAEFGEEEDTAYFAYDLGDGFREINVKRSMPFMLEFFTGYRFALTYFASREKGGEAVFSDFAYSIDD